MWTTPESEGDRHTSIVDSYAGFLSSITSRQRGGVLLFPVGHLIASDDKVSLSSGRTADPSYHGAMVELRVAEGETYSYIHRCY